MKHCKTAQNDKLCNHKYNKNIAGSRDFQGDPITYLRVDSKISPKILMK